MITLGAPPQNSETIQFVRVSSAKPPVKVSPPVLPPSRRVPSLLWLWFQGYPRPPTSRREHGGNKPLGWCECFRGASTLPLHGRHGNFLDSQTSFFDFGLLTLCSLKLCLTPCAFEVWNSSCIIWFDLGSCFISYVSHRPLSWTYSWSKWPILTLNTGSRLFQISFANL